MLQQDLVEGLRPGLVRMATYEEAAAAVADVEAADAAAAAAGEESDASDSDAGSDADGGAPPSEWGFKLPWGCAVWCSDFPRAQRHVNAIGAGQSKPLHLFAALCRQNVCCSCGYRVRESQGNQKQIRRPLMNVGGGVLNLPGLSREASCSSAA